MAISESLPFASRGRNRGELSYGKHPRNRSGVLRITLKRRAGRAALVWDQSIVRLELKTSGSLKPLVTVFQSGVKNEVCRKGGAKTDAR
jgi:hypothetical protein